MAKIYTHTGDRGQTSLVGGKRVAKIHPRLEAYGTVDELSSHLGLLVAMMDHEKDQKHRLYVSAVQNALFQLSAILATEPESKWQPDPFPAALVQQMEAEIDELQAALPQLRAFVVPGGTMAAAQAHVCRTVCRRAERRILAMAETDSVDSQVLEYMNRLSDYLFVLARTLNVAAGTEQVVRL